MALTGLLLALLSVTAAAQSIDGPDWPVLEHKVFESKLASVPVPSLLAELRRGGMVVHFRHGNTPKMDEPTVKNFDDCASQRNLNIAGRGEARAIGEAWRRLGIPVGRVVASSYCRTVETARLAFGDRVERSPEPFDSGMKEQVRAMLSTPPRDGNLVLVGHGGAQNLIGEEFLREGEAIVIRPMGEGRYDLVARVRAEDWAAFLLVE
jgi:phosphohistidine phosphatase SixA